MRDQDQGPGLAARQLQLRRDGRDREGGGLHRAGLRHLRGRGRGLLRQLVRNPGRGSEKPDSTRGSLSRAEFAIGSCVAGGPVHSGRLPCCCRRVAEGNATACVLVTSGQGLGDRMSGRGADCSSLSNSRQPQPSHFYPIQMKLFIDCDI